MTWQKYADQLAEEYDMTIMLSAPYVDLARIAQETKKSYCKCTRNGSN